MSLKQKHDRFQQLDVLTGELLSRMLLTSKGIELKEVRYIHGSSLQDQQ